MRNTHRIAIAILIGIFFAAGFIVRNRQMENERALAARVQSSEPALGPGTRVASTDLDVDFRPVETLYSVVKSLREHYVEQLTSKDEGKMTYDALEAMLGALGDPNTRFLEPDQRKIVTDAREGKFHGIGAMLAIKRVKDGEFTDEHLVVLSPLPGGPAAKAGLKAGDDIVSIDGKSVLPFDPYQNANKLLKDARNRKVERSVLVKELEVEQKRIENGLPIFEAEDMLCAKGDKTVELSVIPAGAAKEKKIKVEPGELAVESVSSSISDDGKYGYLKVNYVSENTPKNFEKTMNEFKSKGLSGMVLDLRGVCGGELEPTLKMAEWFIPGKPLGVLKKSRKRETVLKTPSIDNAWNKRVLVLVDGGTARTGELLASALKQDSNADVVGTKTYGDLTETTMIDQADGSAFVMTSGEYLTAARQNISGKGVQVDVKIEQTGSGDRQLTEAMKMLSAGGNGS